MGLEISADEPIDFPAGSMFWARTAALGPLLGLNFQTLQFEPEQGQQDGTLAHAVERMVFISSELAGYGWCFVGQSRNFDHNEQPIRLLSSADIRDAVEASSRSLTAVRDRRSPPRRERGASRSLDLDGLRCGGSLRLRTSVLRLRGDHHRHYLCRGWSRWGRRSSRRSRRQLKTWFALTSYRRATTDADAPGANDAARSPSSVPTAWRWRRCRASMRCSSSSVRSTVAVPRPPGEKLSAPLVAELKIRIRSSVGV